MSVSPSCRLIRGMASEGFGNVRVPFETVLDLERSAPRMDSGRP